MNEWTIDARASDVVGGVGGHLYLSFWKPDGTLEKQINGLSRSPYDNKTVYASPDNYPLEAVVTEHKNIGGADNDKKFDTNHSVTLFKGSKQDFDKLLSCAETASEQITARKLPYQVIPDSAHFNSNSVFNTIADAMSKTGFIKKETIEDAKIELNSKFPAGIPGGNRNMLTEQVANIGKQLPPEQLVEIQKINLSRVCSNSINNIEFKSDTEHGLSHKIDTKPQPSTVR